MKTKQMHNDSKSTNIPVHHINFILGFIISLLVTYIDLDGLGVALILLYSYRYGVEFNTGCESYFSTTHLNCIFLGR